jgi:hypothetical protein
VHGNPLSLVDRDGNVPADALSDTRKAGIDATQETLKPIFESLGMGGAEGALDRYDPGDHRYGPSIFGWKPLGSVDPDYDVEYLPEGNLGGATGQALGFSDGTFFDAKTDRSQIVFDGHNEPGTPMFAAEGMIVSYVHHVQRTEGRTGMDVVKAAVAATFRHAKDLDLSKKDVTQLGERLKSWATSGTMRRDWADFVDANVEKAKIMFVD